MSEFDSLSTLADWSEKLADLLDEAAAATKEKDDKGRLALARRCREFVKQSPPLLEGISKLDAIALDAAAKLADSVINDAIDRIKSRTVEFTALKKRIESVTDQAERDAAMVRLEPARAIVDSLTATVRAIEDLELVLTNGSDDDLRKKIATILKSIASAKEVFEEVAKP
jgi:hypothetical protein